METDRSVIEQVKGLLDELTETGGRDKTGRDHRRSLAKRMMALLAKIPVPEAEIARRLQISDLTVTRWSKGDNAPRNSQVEQLRRIVELEPQDPDKARLPLTQIGPQGRLIGVYPFDHFFDRVADPRKPELYVSEVYALKSLLGFHAGNEAETAAALYELLSRFPDLKIHYIYPSQFQRSPTPAHDTFAMIREEHRLRDVQKQLIELSINSEQKDCETLVALGLGYSHLGYFVLVYNEKGRDRYLRDIDILVELPCQRYMEGLTFFDREGPEYLFVELPHTTVASLWKVWKPAIERLKNEIKANQIRQNQRKKKNQ